ncbi:hypothetical protein B0A48_03850 [Cryoendolithus antarcticus]|uniref:CSN8/PSMD8/EIF3K domain-containing protein n=1 Tax=Cryoendolithus antarcticus TaxID=1507870 RepID=A0A1V8TH50_9PEZI|nr:hypothetical protein B0A48_03850 [Cryoendolithus antarcticus]
MRFCASSGTGEDLEAAFTNLSINPAVPSKRNDNDPADSTRPPLSHRPSAQSAHPSSDLPNILLAMRKMREGIVASHRTDAFAQRVYIFIIQAAILTRQWEAYQAPLLHLLNHIHPRTPLSPTELRDFVDYRILDLACRQNDLSGAYAVKLEFGQRSRRVDAVLKALVSDDWVRFWRIKRVVDGYQRALMEFAEERMRMHVLKCIGRSYLSVEKGFMERAASAKWEILVKECGVGWQLLESGMVVVRRPKVK